MAISLGLSKGEAHNSFRRALAAAFIHVDNKEARVDLPRFLSFIAHGISSTFYPIRGPVGLGLPTGFWASPLDKKRRPGGHTIPLVWQVDEKPGLVRGETIVPLYPTVPQVADRDYKMYQLLAMVDAVRVSTGRDKEVALEALEKRLIPEAEDDAGKGG